MPRTESHLPGSIDPVRDPVRPNRDAREQASELGAAQARLEAGAQQASLTTRRPPVPGGATASAQVAQERLMDATVGQHDHHAEDGGDCFSKQMGQPTAGGLPQSESEQGQHRAFPFFPQHPLDHPPPPLPPPRRRGECRVPAAVNGRHPPPDRLGRSRPCAPTSTICPSPSDKSCRAWCQYCPASSRRRRSAHRAAREVRAHPLQATGWLSLRPRLSDQDGSLVRSNLANRYSLLRRAQNAAHGGRAIFPISCGQDQARLGTSGWRRATTAHCQSSRTLADQPT